MNSFVVVALGGAIGASLRYGSGLLIERLAGGTYPMGTLFVNIFGSFIMGAVAGYFMLKGGSAEVRLFAMTGLLGGFTTFSAFSLETMQLWERGQAGLAAVHVAAMILLCLIAVVAGAKLVKVLA